MIDFFTLFVEFLALASFLGVVMGLLLILFRIR